MRTAEDGRRVESAVEVAAERPKLLRPARLGSCRPLVSQPLAKMSATMNTLGFFSEPSYITIGDPYASTEGNAARSVRCSGRCSQQSVS